MGNVRVINEVTPSIELAEIIGIMLGDGNIYEKTYLVRVCGNLYTDQEYLRNHVKKLFAMVFGITPKEIHLKNITELILYVSNKQLMQTLFHFGIGAGNKKKHNAKIPCWIMENENYLCACLRGLFDTDGTVFKHRGRMKIELISGISGIQITVEKAMRKLGFQKRWSKPDSHGVRRYGIYSKKDVEMFINRIGFNNIKHSKKIQRARMV